MEVLWYYYGSVNQENLSKHVKSVHFCGQIQQVTYRKEISKHLPQINNAKTYRHYLYIWYNLIKLFVLICNMASSVDCSI